jgi:sterol desaturase/sphingolipid hydroxylase (fatty acid hydroxylase superfamily)
LIVVGIALISFYWFQRRLKKRGLWQFGWIAEMFVRNVALMTIVAGGLHLYFYTYTKQGQALEIRPARPLMKNGRQFTLGGQIRDNIFWTIASGVTVWTAYEVLMFWPWPTAMRRC